ncbi:MAG: helix-turn-helix domain-containing protein, partial [Balneolales bacterium]|nr:helix-turn-helix domain-containing protein [Balneolales bacterium]
YEDNNNNVWFGTAHGIRIWDRNSGSITNLPSPFDRQTVQVKVIQQNGRKNLWAGSRDGLYNYEMETNVWNKVPVENDLDIQIEQLSKSENGEVWVGTRQNGLYTLKNDTLIAFSGNNQLSDIRIRSIYNDNEGVLWVGLNGGGLHRIELNPNRISSKSITKYTPENGLLGSVIHIIMEDDYGRIWMSSNQGIFWVPKQQLNDVASGALNRIHPIIYQIEDGLPGNEANGGAQTPGITSRDGAFWFAMLSGITRIHPKKVNDLTFSFPSVIESVSNKDSMWTPGSANIRIPKRDRSIRISYTAFNYSVKPEDIRFSYKLGGTDDEWIYAGAERSVTFTNLKAGMYTFALRAGMGNIWDNSNISSIQITVEPHLHERRSFQLAILGSFLGAIISLVTWARWKKKMELEKHEIELQKLEILKTKRDTFLEELNRHVEEILGDSNADTKMMADRLLISERQLQRKLKEYTGLTPAKYLREMRLLRAKYIFENNPEFNISEVAYSLGFHKPSYFTKVFKTRFNVHPKELRETKNS